MLPRRPFSKRFIAAFGATIMVTLFACASVLRAAETPVDFRTVIGSMLHSPMPEIPRVWATHSYCAANLVVDPTTGLVTNVYVAESSGDDYFNYKIVDVLRQWKFRPGTPKLIRISFGTGGGWTGQSTAKERRSKRMDDVLAPFLGKGALIRGELPEYPSKPAWTDKHGTGVFVLHIDSSGKVSDVTIKSRSGDPPFDQVAVAALQQWHFRKGPLTLVLPLSFVLTSTKFSIHIPKYP
jgi:TonB family protein